MIHLFHLLITWPQMDWCLVLLPLKPCCRAKLCSFAVFCGCLWLSVCGLPWLFYLSGFLRGILQSVVVVCVMLALCGKGHVFHKPLLPVTMNYFNNSRILALRFHFLIRRSSNTNTSGVYFSSPDSVHLIGSVLCSVPGLIPCTSPPLSAHLSCLRQSYR